MSAGPFLVRKRARAPRDFAPIHGAADSFEPRFAKAFVKAMERVRASGQITTLALALEQARQNYMRRPGPVNPKDVDAAVRPFVQALALALAPLGDIVRDATIKGGKLGAATVRAQR